MKIFDCVTFFEEKRQMNLRFNILNDYVEKFIVCEGQYDHRGNKKKINFKADEFPQFKYKIKHVICKSFPKELNGWERQAYQRDFILQNIQEISDEDLIMFSDPDEIPNPLKLKNLKLKKKYGIFLQKLFYYKLNLQDISLGNNWEGTRICKKKNLKSIDYLRKKILKNNLKYGFWKLGKEKSIDIIDNGGWHFSYLLTPKEIQKKIKTFAHNELNLKKYTNLANINLAINNGKDLFHRKVIYNKVNIDESYPEYIKNNQHNLKEWIC